MKIFTDFIVFEKIKNYFIKTTKILEHSLTVTKNEAEAREFTTLRFARRRSFRIAL